MKTNRDEGTNSESLSGDAPQAQGKQTLTGGLIQRQVAPDDEGLDGGSDASDAFGLATSEPAEEVPFREEMESAFGADFGGVKAHLGGPKAQQGLKEMGARAAAMGDQVAFDSPTPDKGTVAHELTHVVQQDAAASPEKPQLLAVLSWPGDAAEQEAESIGAAVAAGQPQVTVSVGTGRHVGKAPKPAVAAGGGAAKPDAPKTAMATINEAMKARPINVKAVAGALDGLQPAERMVVLLMMPTLAPAFGAQNEDLLDPLIKLNASITDIIRFLRTAGQLVKLATPAFRLKFQKAPVTELGALMVNPSDVAAIRAAAPTLGPLDCEAFPSILPILFIFPAAVQWTIDAAGGVVPMIAKLTAPMRATVKSMVSAVETILRHPTAFGIDVIEQILKPIGLKPTESVPRLCATGHEGQLALPPFTTWFSAETTAAELISFIGSPEFTRFKAAVGGAVRPLTLSAVTQPSDLGKVMGDRPSFVTWAAEIQTWDEVFVRFSAAAADNGFINALIGGSHWWIIVPVLGALRASGVEKARTAIDLLFAGASRVGNLDACKSLFTARFGIQLGGAGNADAKDLASGGANTETEYDVAGLTRIYNAFKVLPPSQIESGALGGLTRKFTYYCPNDTDHDVGDPSGTAPRCPVCNTALRKDEGTSGVTRGAKSKGSADNVSGIALQYNQTNTGALDNTGARDATGRISGGFTEPGQAMFGLNLLDGTAVHEFAHALDNRRNVSADAGFRALLDWEEHPLSNGPGLIGSMMAYGLSIPADVTGKDETAAVNAAIRGFEAQVGTVDQIRPHFDTSYDIQYPDQGGFFDWLVGTSDKELNRRAQRDALWLKLSATNLFKHIAAGKASHEPWMAEPFAYLGGRQFHQGYGGRSWWSYRPALNTNALSGYQLRDPGEHFAELYATWWVTTPAGANISGKQRAWFLAMGLDQR